MREQLDRELRFSVLRRDGFTCQYCGRKAPAVVLHIDHVIPVAAGGSNDAANLVACCEDCNLGKGIRSVALVQRAKLSSDVRLEQAAEFHARRAVEFWREYAGVDCTVSLANMVDFVLTYGTIAVRRAIMRTSAGVSAHKVEPERSAAYMRVVLDGLKDEPLATWEKVVIGSAPKKKRKKKKSLSR